MRLKDWYDSKAKAKPHPLCSALRSLTTNIILYKSFGHKSIDAQLKQVMTAPPSPNNIQNYNLLHLSKPTLKQSGPFKTFGAPSLSYQKKSSRNLNRSLFKGMENATAPSTGPQASFDAY